MKIINNLLIISILCGIISAQAGINDSGNIHLDGSVPADAATVIAPAAGAFVAAVGGAGGIDPYNLLAAGTLACLCVAPFAWYKYKNYPWKTADQITFDDLKKEVLVTYKDTYRDFLETREFMLSIEMDGLGLYKFDKDSWAIRGSGVYTFEELESYDKNCATEYMLIELHKKALDQKNNDQIITAIIQKPWQKKSDIEKQQTLYYNLYVRDFGSKYELSKDQLHALTNQVPSYIATLPTLKVKDTRVLPSAPIVCAQEREYTRKQIADFAFKVAQTTLKHSIEKIQKRWDTQSADDAMLRFGHDYQ